VKAFFDSNIVVYAFAGDGDPRRNTAVDLIDKYRGQRNFVLSVQVLMETYNLLTRKKAVASVDAMAIVRLLARGEVVSPSAEAVLLALQLARQHQLQTWDGLIVQAALEAGCDVLLTEDLQAGRRFGSLEVVNPFLNQAHEASPSYGNPPTTSPAPSRAKGKRKVKPAASARK
jgi:predicted nucleic acid-binding protein